ncbi:MAG TPA: CopG family transcriptional regulator [Thermoanaerobaculia bacterium]|nr:CopG family transcriptional regulator [Thermoanaerobaculia bacterium]
MKKTTVYLPDDLKRKLEFVAKKQARSEADVIREAIEAAVKLVAPRPKIPLVGKGRRRTTHIAEHVDERLDGFGE